MNRAQIMKVIDELSERGYQQRVIEWWLRRDPNIIEEYLGIKLSNI